MLIRTLRPDDVGLAAKIVGENYSARYALAARKELRAMFGTDTFKPHYLVAEEHGKIVGFAGYVQSWMDYHVYQIFWVNVRRAHQKRGIGSTLVGKVLEQIRSKRGVDSKAYMVLLTTTSPDYYAKKFGFETMAKFKEGKNYSLMALSLERTVNF